MYAQGQETDARPLSLPIVTGLLAGGSTLYLLSAMDGVWAAYDRTTALQRFVVLAVGLAFVWVVPRLDCGGPEETLGWLGLTCAWGGALVGGFYLAVLAADRWAIGEPVTVSEMFSGGLHDNLVAGLSLVLLPFALGGLIWARAIRAHIVAVLAAAAFGITVAAMVASQSRGALLGALAGAAVAGYSAWRFRPGRSPTWHVADLALLALGAGGIAVYVYAIGTGGEGWAAQQLQQLAGEVASGTSRLQLWQDSLVLIGDYPFTGSGLTGTAMVLSTYVFLLHVPYLYHAHNLFLQVAVEQGIPGLIGFLGIVSAAFTALAVAWPKTKGMGRVFAALTMASLLALLVHGLFDSELYVSVFAPIVFVPMGISLLVYRQTRAQRGALGGPVFRTGPLPVALAALLVVGLTAAILFGPWKTQVESALYSNLGAVAQTRAELGVYEWPEWSIQDEVRVSDPSLLDPAVDWFGRALQINPVNVTASRRLGQIELSLGNYVEANHHLEQAFRGAMQQRALRQMLGEALAIESDVNGAVALWQGNSMNQGQIELRVWWYGHRGEVDVQNSLMLVRDRLIP